MRKSRLFSLLCAFWPGAGEMYLGLMKRGIGIMILFWFALAIGLPLDYLYHAGAVVLFLL